MNRTGKKWTPEQRAKFMATSKRMRKDGTWPMGKGKKKGAKVVTSIPLEAIPERPRKAAKAPTNKSILVDQQRLQLAMGIVVLLNRIMDGK